MMFKVYSNDVLVVIQCSFNGKGYISINDEIGIGKWVFQGGASFVDRFC